MECVGCRSGSDPDRIVIDILTDGEVGLLCDHCIDTTFREVFNDPVWHQDSGCSVCAETPQYYLPLISCLIEFEDDRSSEVEYSITESTVRLCSGHLEDIIVGSPAATPYISEAVQQRSH
jgi:hypothetical protein